ncbi:hypothetical protein HHK36_009607 [Tetracentron sinense]|uniref:AP2/ERF domain-containing protein n=1 Tax=Tetracentron sinense TaxID=13715 RepID=A0A835DHM9_TETSI|nr:hypothetical protein HHK36_009607 [Tetracentron sinense]
MAPVTNWLSFSLSPMEMLRSCQSQMLPTKLMPYGSSSDSSQHFFENFDGYDWQNHKAQIPYTEQNQVEEIREQSIADLSILTSLNPQIQPQTVPKLEDFLGGHSSSLARYSDSQTETQESSLSNVHEQGSSHFSNQQDLNAIAATAGFQAFSANSGSEIDDSMSVNGTRFTCGDFTGKEIVFSNSPRKPLSLGVIQSSGKPIVSVDSECSKKVTDNFGQRTSVYRGVTRHRWTGRYEAHLWDNSCRREGQSRKGRQGGYDKEEKAARAYDLAALKYWGPTATTNFPVSNYNQEIEEMKHMTKQEFIASLRRKSSGFSRGASIYRGVTRHHQQGRWQARIGRVAGNKDLYLGTFGTEEEAAEAYDIAAIKFRGVNAVTNFEMNRYDVEAIANSALPIGGAAKRLKLSLESKREQSLLDHDLQSQCSSGSIGVAAIQPIPTISCGIPLDSTTALYHQNLLHILHSNNVGTSDSSGSNSFGTPTALLQPPPEFCSRSLLYGHTNPINITSYFNINDSSAKVNQQPWNVASSFN